MSSSNERIAEIGQRVLAGERIGRPGARALVEAAGRSPHELLYWADRVRKKHFGDAVVLCAIVPGKVGGCSQDCKWCAQSAATGPDVSGAPQATSRSDIVAAAGLAARNGAGSFGIVNSGRCPTAAELEAVTDAAKAIGADARGPKRLCASLGELDDAKAARLAAAGITRYNHNLETSRDFFPHVVTSHTYDDRLATLRAARNAGLSLCCGGIFGLGETWDDRIDLALKLRDEVAPDVVPLNFLHPIPGTPLETATPLHPMEILSIIAVFRLLLATVDIKVAGGREVNLRGLQSWIFRAGATSCLIGNYLTTPGQDAAADLQMIADLGLRVVQKLPTPQCRAQEGIRGGRPG